MKTKLSLIIFIIMLFSLLATSYYIAKITVLSSRANSSNTSDVSLQNSYVFASPLTALAQNREHIRLTVFLLNQRGLGVGQQAVSIPEINGLTVTAIQPLTDDTGKAIFDLSSETANNYTLQAQVNGLNLSQKVKVSFY